MPYWVSSGPMARFHHSLCRSSLNNEPSDHHVVTGLHKAASTDVVRNESVSGVRSYTSTSATPVVLATPRTIAV